MTLCERCGLRRWSQGWCGCRGTARTPIRKIHNIDALLDALEFITEKIVLKEMNMAALKCVRGEIKDRIRALVYGAPEAYQVHPAMEELTAEAADG